MTRRSEWPEEAAAEGALQDGGGPVPSRAGTRPPRRAEASRDPLALARALCLRLLSASPRTRGELTAVLRGREFPEEVIGQVLERFEEAGLVDDEAFARAWVDSRHHGRGLARPALARELRTRGVDAAVIEGALGRLDTALEERTARELVTRRLRVTRGVDPARRTRRLLAMLARRGYQQATALRVVRQALAEEGEDAGIPQDSQDALPEGGDD